MSGGGWEGRFTIACATTSVLLPPPSRPAARILLARLHPLLGDGQRSLPPPMRRPAMP
jgi:hypothetical protein